MNPSISIPLIFSLAFLIILGLVIATLKRAVIFEFQRGLLYRNGKFVSVLGPGQHFYLSPFGKIQLIDIREQYITLPGQELLSADNVSIKISLMASYRVIDPYTAVASVSNYMEALYSILQVHLRDIVGSMNVDELLGRRAELGEAVFEQSKEKAGVLGLELTAASAKDIMFPGELKNIFAQVVNARNEGLAALERARGEHAALRSLANAARLLDGNPSLRQLRLLQTLENKSGNTVILLGDELPGMKDLPEKAKRSTAK